MDISISDTFALINFGFANYAYQSHCIILLTIWKRYFSKYVTTQYYQKYVLL